MENYDVLGQLLTKTLNEIPEVKQLFASTPNYRFWRDGKRGTEKHRWFYTTEKCNHNGEQVYLAGIYKRVSKTSFKLIKKSPCDTRKEAKQIAQNWYHKNITK